MLYRTNTYREEYFFINPKQEGEFIMKVAKFTESFTVALTRDVYLKIKEITDEKSISMGEWVRKIIDGALAQDSEHTNPFNEFIETI